MSQESATSSIPYFNPDVESSYRENDLGRTLYDAVLTARPYKIVEFGVLNGYSTIAMAQALRKLGRGVIIGYDIWEHYPYKHTTMQQTIENIKRYGLEEYVILADMDFNDWHGEKCDMVHIDISNTAETIDRIYSLTDDIPVLFEGGSAERDKVEWVTKYNKTAIGKTNVPFEVLNSNFPSVSVCV